MQTKSKKTAFGILSAALVLAISIGGTLAYLTRETEKRVNNFTFVNQDSAMNATLTEPEWDGVIDYVYDPDDGTIANVVYGYTYKDDDADPTTPEVVDKTIYGYEGGDKSKPVYDPDGADAGVKPTFDSTDVTYKPEYGVDKSKNMIPGQAAWKNPIITNTGNVVDEWVAAKVTFVYGADSENAGEPLSGTDMALVKDLITIDWNTGTDSNTWDRYLGTAADVSQVFFYQDILSKGPEDLIAGKYGDSTEPLFTTVKLIEAATNAQVKLLQDMGGIAIYVEGYAAQSDVGQNYIGFKKYGLGADNTAGTADDGVIFTATPTAEDPAIVTEPGIIAK